MNKPRILFTHAAIFNGLVGFAILLAYKPVFNLTGLSPIPENPIFLHLFALLVLVFGLGYYWAGLDFQKNISIVKMGVIGKLLIFLLTLGYFLAGNVTWPLFALTSVDFVYALLFISAIRQNRE